VHETKVEQLRVGMRARIRILDRELQGAVSSIANQPEPTSFFSASVKEYGTIVKIDGQPAGLRPGMTSEVEILVAHLKDVLTLPVAAVVEQRGKYFCWVTKAGGQTERRSLVLGLNNDQFVEVKDGVAAGDKVLLNPRAVVPEARVNEEEAEPTNVGEQFGESKPTAGPAAGSERGAFKPPAEAGGPPPGGPNGGGAPGGSPAGPGGSRSGGFDLMQLDADGDGKVSKQEAPERMQEGFDAMDTNKDGALDQAEIKALREMMRAKFRGGAPSGGPSGGS
jgi:HlyD family secretion protein